MFGWLAENLATLLLCAALLTAVAGIVIHLARNRKKGKSSCGCGCESCPMSGNCHPGNGPGIKPQ